MKKNYLLISCVILLAVLIGGVLYCYKNSSPVEKNVRHPQGENNSSIVGLANKKNNRQTIKNAHWELINTKQINAKDKSTFAVMGTPSISFAMLPKGEALYFAIFSYTKPFYGKVAVYQFKNQQWKDLGFTTYTFAPIWGAIQLINYQGALYLRFPGVINNQYKPSPGYVVHSGRAQIIYKFDPDTGWQFVDDFSVAPPHSGGSGYLKVMNNKLYFLVSNKAEEDVGFVENRRCLYEFNKGAFKQVGDCLIIPKVSQAELKSLHVGLDKNQPMIQAVIREQHGEGWLKRYDIKKKIYIYDQKSSVWVQQSYVATHTNVAQKKDKYAVKMDKINHRWMALGHPFPGEGYPNIFRWQSSFYALAVSPKEHSAILKLYKLDTRRL